MIFIRVFLNGVMAANHHFFKACFGKNVGATHAKTTKQKLKQLYKMPQHFQDAYPLYKERKPYSDVLQQCNKHISISDDLWCHFSYLTNPSFRNHQFSSSNPSVEQVSLPGPQSTTPVFNNFLINASVMV